MTFQRPELLPLLPLALLILAGAILWQWRRGVRLVRAYGGPGPALRLTGRSSLADFPAARLVCAFVGASALLLVAAGIRPDDGEPPLPPTPLDLVIALDVSHSMTATDVEPSRMARAKATARALFDAGVADRVALTTFAAWPYGLVPVTDDATVAEYFLPWVEPELVESRHQGTALAAAVDHAVDALRARPRPEAVPVLVVLSDGEAHGSEASVVASVEAAAEAGVRIWAGGVGTEEGTPLFVSRGSGAPLLETDGGRVTAGYDPALLLDMARMGGGAVHDIGADAGVDALVADLRSLRGGGTAPEDAGFDPAGALLLIGLLALLLEALVDRAVLERRREVEA